MQRIAAVEDTVSALIWVVNGRDQNNIPLSAYQSAQRDRLLAEKRKNAPIEPAKPKMTAAEIRAEFRRRQEAAQQQ